MCLAYNCITGQGHAGVPGEKKSRGKVYVGHVYYHLLYISYIYNIYMIYI